jgi:chromosome segregation ATPase
MSDSKNGLVSRQVSEPTTFWRNWRVFVSNRGEMAPAPNETPRGDLADFNYLAQVSEDIRERYVSIINRTDELVALRRDFVEVFAEVGKILTETEETNSALMERTALLAHEEEEHGVLKTLYQGLREASDRHANENNLLRSEIERFGELVSSREARIRALEEELAKRRDENDGLFKELEHERSAHAQSLDRLDNAVNDSRGHEDVVLRQQSEIAELSDRSSVAEFQANSLEKSLVESQAVAKGLRDSLAESQQQIEGLLQKLEASNAEIKSSESGLVSAKLAHEIAQTIWQEKEQATSDELDRLNRLANTERARAEASESQLAATRAELQTTAASLRVSEREAEQLAVKIAPLDERIEGLVREIASLTEKTADGERSRSALADRAHAMVRAMSDLKAKLELAEEKAQQLEGRLVSEAGRSAANSEQMEARIRALTESFEKEKAARLVALSALAAARSKVTRQREAESLHDILARADAVNPEALPNSAADLPADEGSNGA